MQRYNPLFEIVRQLDRDAAARCVSARLFRKLCVGRKSAGGALVLGPREERRNFRRAWGAFLRFVRWLVGRGRSGCGSGQLRALGTTFEDQVQCTVRYGDEVHVNFYHGFHQPGRMDRQELAAGFRARRSAAARAGCRRTRAFTRLRTKQQTRGLCELFPGARLDVLVAYGPKDRHCAGHGREYDVYQQFELHWGEGRQKSRVYCELLRGLHDRSGRVDSRPRPRAENDGTKRARFGRDGVCGGPDGAW